MFPSAFITAMVAQALLTVCCAKKPGKSVSYCPAVLLGSLAVEGSHLKRNIRAWRGCSADSASGSSEYRSSTMYGTASVFRSSLIIDKEFSLAVGIFEVEYVREDTRIRFCEFPAAGVFARHGCQIDDRKCDGHWTDLDFDAS